VKARARLDWHGICQRKSGNTALTARSAEKGRSPNGAPKKKREYRYIGGHKKGGSDTMLNILYIERKNKRERESGSVNTQWTTLYCVVINMWNTIASLYRRERGKTSCISNVGQALGEAYLCEHVTRDFSTLSNVGQAHIHIL
jgi:hypothetical protein